MNLHTSHHEIEESAQRWVMRENEGLSGSERRELELWLKNREHQEVYEEQKKLIGECLDLDDEFIRELEEEAETPRQKSSFLALLVAACLVVFVGWGIKDYYFEPIFEQEYVSHHQKLLNIVLPDDSVIDLDIKSSLKIAYYKHKREVELLAGKALFSVEKEAKKPFIVRVGGAQIEVVGTKFEVANIENRLSVNVLEGVVMVKTEGRSVYQLGAAQAIAFDSHGEVQSFGAINTQKIADWKNDTLFFDKTTLGDAAAQFEYYTGKRIVFEDARVAHLKMSGKFSTSHFRGFLDSIELIHPVKIRQEEQTIKIVKK